MTGNFVRVNFNKGVHGIDLLNLCEQEFFDLAIQKESWLLLVK